MKKTMLIPVAFVVALAPATSHAASALGSGRNSSANQISGGTYGWPTSQQAPTRKARKGRRQDEGQR